ncbi:hypothetical protein FEA48_10080 [Pseudomonas nitroreducens]|uniref:Multi-ubiquitin domain-containing protein n=1 Tax=Pseudomonas nitroreducens TaxID=46680 RepID=A0A5R9A759_PSENT|nr:multiubiquitin domain-containing protein [Pseudomonas nitroreducens]TLP74562.1 hypothetical protein FEA48_10080 [Pseudomonas nitroreducens]
MQHEHGNKGQGAEHQPETKHIIVNARQKPFDGDRITYQQVVALAFPGDDNPEIIYTVSFVGPNILDGTLAEGQSVAIRNGMKFDVKKTNRS